MYSLPVPAYHWKNLSIDFVTKLLVSTNWKGKSFDLILVIVDQLTKTVYHKPIKLTIDTPGLTKVIINVVVRHHGLFDSIVSDQGSVFTLMFWSLLCYFLGIKPKLYTAF